MAYSIIQIKYSVSNTATPTLEPGELAYSQAGNNLFIGSPDGISGTVRIGGIYNDGILTANQALVANSTGGINIVYAANVNSYYVNAYYVNTHIVNTEISHANASYVNYLYVDTIEANNIILTTNVATASINTEIITSNTLNVNNISAVFTDSYTVNAHGVDVEILNIHQSVIANGSYGNVGDILYSSGEAGNTYWGVLALDSTVVNTSGDFTLAGTYDFANQISITGALVDSTGNTGTATTYLASTDANTVVWKELLPPYYYTTEMYDYTEYGIGWMNVAPNQNAETLGFRTDVNIPFGAIWILAINDGTVDEPPITIYSPSTRTTPMLWMSIDGTGPYDPDTNPNGQAYWFNITPPPSGA